MVNVLAVRDIDKREVVVCEELPADHKASKTYADARTKYPAPRYEVMLVIAPSMEDFLKNYPRFRGKGETKAAAGGTAAPSDAPKPPAGGTKPPKPGPEGGPA